MVFCRQCQDDVEAEVDEAGGYAACPLCGLILEAVAFSSDVQFAKGADGEGELVGQFVSETGQVRGIGRMAGGRLWGARVSCRAERDPRARKEAALPVAWGFARAA